MSNSRGTFSNGKRWRALPRDPQAAALRASREAGEFKRAASRGKGKGLASLMRMFGVQRLKKGAGTPG